MPVQFNANPFIKDQIDAFFKAGNAEAAVDFVETLCKQLTGALFAHDPESMEQRDAYIRYTAERALAFPGFDLITDEENKALRRIGGLYQQPVHPGQSPRLWHQHHYALLQDIAGSIAHDNPAWAVSLSLLAEHARDEGRDAANEAQAIGMFHFVLKESQRAGVTLHRVVFSTIDFIDKAQLPDDKTLPLLKALAGFDLDRHQRKAVNILALGNGTRLLETGAPQDDRETRRAMLTQAQETLDLVKDAAGHVRTRHETLREMVTYSLGRISPSQSAAAAPEENPGPR